MGLITGGGRGIGEAVARELVGAGMRVAVTGRTESQVRSVADAVGGLALIGDVSQQRDVEAWVAETEQQLGPIDVKLQPAGPGHYSADAMDIPAAGTWTLQISVRKDEFTAYTASTRFPVR